MIDMRKNKQYTFVGHILYIVLAFVLVLLPMYWLDFINSDSVLLIFGITVAYYPMYRILFRNRQIDDQKEIAE